MENFKKLIEIVNTLSDKKMTGIKEIEKYDELIKSIFKNKKIFYINSPSFFIDVDGTVVNNTSEASFVQTSTRIIKNLEDVSFIKSQNLYIYQIFINENNNGMQIRLYETNSIKAKKTFTISENIYNEFSDIANKLAINKSKFVENKIVEFINKNK